MVTRQAMVLRSECSACDILVHWKVVDSETRSDWEPLDAPSGFVCKHWEDHHEAAERARLSKTRQASAGPVEAEVLSRNQTQNR
jgi:hypothetical protein